MSRGAGGVAWWVAVLVLLFVSIVRPTLLSAADPVASPSTNSLQINALVGQMERHWPTNRTLTVVCHGHSVPAGYFVTPVVDTFNAYPHLLHVELKRRFPHAVINVVVTAIGGENSVSGAARFSRDVLPLRPDLLLVDYTLNDRGVGLEKAGAAWSEMVRLARERGIPVLLLTGSPDQRSSWMEDSKDPLAQHAEQVRRLARTLEVGLVDSLGAFQRAVSNGTPVRELMSQVNHPNRAGHELITREILKQFPPVP